MQTKTVGKIMKHSFIYSYAVTQPFLFHIDIQSQIEDQSLAEAEELSYGENSEVVRHLQHKLSKLGFLNDPADGVYGLLTESAVKGFQSSQQIEVSGQVDYETMQALLHTEKKEQISEIEDLLKNIQFGEESDEVEKVQEVLFYYGYYKGNIDGIYGPLTDNAIFQLKEEGLFQSVHTENEKQATPSADTSLDEEPVTAPKTINKDKKESNVTKNIRNVKTNNNANEIIQQAKQHLGTPYVWGGTTPNGFDCSGYIQFIYGEQDITIPRTVREIWNFATPTSTLAIGDLVFFETYQSGPSHMGIYLGNGDFIHAGSNDGVTISNMNDNPYWQSRYLGAKRI